MTLFAITSDYFSTGCFGIYSSLKRAHAAAEHFFLEDSNIVSFDFVSDYTYQIFTQDEKTYYIDISCDILDFEFINGRIKEEDD